MTYVELVRQVLIWGLNFLGSIGIVLIVYGLYAARTKTPYPVLESIADWLAQLATLGGVLVTALTIYLPSNNRPPELLSLYFTGPVVILAAFVGLWFVVVRRWMLPRHVLNGFALLGICGVLFRILV